MNKSYRHGQILRVIASRAVHTQDELGAALAAEAGIQASQVTLSRDVHELGLVKTPQGYRQGAPPREGPSLLTLAQEVLRDVRVAKNLLVLRTLSGSANALAAALDREQWTEIVGTVAGDDTVLVVAPDDAVALELRGRLQRLIGA